MAWALHELAVGLDLSLTLHFWCQSLLMLSSGLHYQQTRRAQPEQAMRALHISPHCARVTCAQRMACSPSRGGLHTALAAGCHGPCPAGIIN